MTFNEHAEQVIRHLQKSQASEGIIIGDLLNDIHQQGDLTPDTAEGILDEIIGWAEETKKELLKPEFMNPPSQMGARRKDWDPRKQQLKRVLFANYAQGTMDVPNRKALHKALRKIAKEQGVNDATVFQVWDELALQLASVAKERGIPFEAVDE